MAWLAIVAMLVSLTVRTLLDVVRLMVEAAAMAPPLCSHHSGGEDILVNDDTFPMRYIQYL